jgi:hypothetical protein
VAPSTPIAPFFRLTDFARPATYTNAAGLSKDIAVLPDTNYEASFVGDTEAQNARTTVIAREEDLPGLDNDATLVLHAVLLDEDGMPLLDGDGEMLIAEGIETYQIHRPEYDGYGMVRLTLHTN